MKRKHVNYTFEISNKCDIDNTHSIIEDLLNELNYRVVFIGYDNINIKITFENNLTDEQENLLMTILLKYL